MAEHNIDRIGGVIVSHGQVANELVAAAEAVVGDVNHIAAVSIGWHDDVEMAQNAIDSAIKQVDAGRGVLLLTDMFGGTPTNIAAMFLEPDNVEIITGVNLPMVIKLASADDDVSLHDLAISVEGQGKEAICMAGGLLEPPKMKKDA
ncbi:MAG: PTS sugar transporter subunit IIA [Pyrinomonadaceae bacterium]